MAGFTALGGLLDMQRRYIRAKPENGDSYGPDGLLVCGRCGTPKECRVDLWEPRSLSDGTPNAYVGTEPRFVVRPTPCSCEAERMRAEEEERSKSRAKALRAACYDLKGLEGVTFADDDGRQPECSKVARSYVEHFERAREMGQGMMFGGGTGSGKTFMAAMVANALLDMGYKCRFTNLPTLNESMTADYGSNRRAVLESIARCDLVVIDDLGTERTTGTANENVYQIVDTISRKKVPVIVTTNLSAEKLLGDPDYRNGRVYSRLIERCRGVAFKGGDRRAEANRHAEWAF